MRPIQAIDDAVAQTVMLFSFTVGCVEAVGFVDNGYLLPFVNTDDVGVCAGGAEGFPVTFCHDAVFCPFEGAGRAPKVVSRHAATIRHEFWLGICHPVDPGTTCLCQTRPVAIGL